MITDIEMPSGKGASDENFPVASWLLPARLRPHVMAFYHFVRAADDIADHAELTADDKLARLDVFERALLGESEALRLLPKARTLRASLSAAGVTDRHALDLLQAFKRDASKNRYDDWQDLLSYCALSASPVGRFLLDLHGEDQELRQLSDPLCDALQVLNHVQDCRRDFLDLDRVYLPLDGFSRADIDVEALAEPSANPAMRHVLDHILDGCDDLLQDASELPRWTRDRRLAAETAVILEMARTLAAKLRAEDPLATRVELSKPRFMLTALVGIGRLQWARRGSPVRASLRKGETVR